MRTDGLNAFDKATRLELEALLRPREMKRQHERKLRAVKPPPKPRKTGLSTQCAQLWLEYEAKTPARRRMTKTAFAKLHNVKLGSFSSALFYLTHPDALQKKHDRHREKMRDLKAEIRAARASSSLTQVSCPDGYTAKAA